MNLNSARDYLTEQFNENGDSGWIEGWICGYTDPDHNNTRNEAIKESLFKHLETLRDEANAFIQFDTVKDLIDHLRPYKTRSLIVDNDGSTYGALAGAFNLWNENDPESPFAIYKKRL